MHTFLLLRKKTHKTLSDYMREGLEAFHFKIIYHDRQSKVTNEMKLMSAKPQVITNGHANGRTRGLLPSRAKADCLIYRAEIEYFGLG